MPRSANISAGTLTRAQTQQLIAEEVVNLGISNGLTFIANWDATTNTPTLSSGDTVTPGEYYIVSGSGSYDLGEGTKEFAAGDWVVSMGTGWSKVDNTDNEVTAHIGDLANPHQVTKTQVGLSNVPNVDATDADNISDGTTNAIITQTQESNFESAYSHSQVTTGNPHSVTKTDVGLGNVANVDTTTADNINDGSTNAIITLTQETNFESAYNHSQVTTGNPHNVTGSDVGISAFGATLVDDTDAATARGTLGVDVAGTDNSTDVTLNADDPTQQTLNLAGQELQVNLATTSTDGAMSAEDKTKLDNVEAANFNYQIGLTYTVQASDLGKIISMNNANPVTLVVPGGLGVNFSFAVLQKGDGIITFDNNAGATTLNNVSAHTGTAGKHGIVSFFSDVADEFIFTGATA
jgi:hypothetical protein